MTPKNYLDNVVLKTWDGRGTQEQCFYGFLEEFGEITGKLRKAHRDDVPEEEKTRLLKKELGDYIWYLTHLAYLRKSVDFDSIQFKQDNLDANSDKFRAVLENEIKIGALTESIANDDYKLEQRMMGKLFEGFTDMSNALGFEVQDILKTSANKLFSRMLRGKMHGSGDER